MRRLLTPVLLAVLVTLAGFAGLTAIDRTAQVQFQDRVRHNASHRLLATRAALEDALHQRLLLTHGLAAFVKGNPEPPDNEFALFAAELIGEQTGIRSLQLAKGGVVSHVYPLAGNEAALGHELLADPTRRAAAQQALETESLVVGGPYELRQGGRGIVGRLPILTGTTGQQGFWGFAIVVMDFDTLVESTDLAGGDEDLAYALRGRDGRGLAGELFFGDPVVLRTQPVATDVQLPTGTWHLAAAPPQGWPTLAPHTWQNRIGGAALALMAGLLTWLVGRRPAELEAAVTRATAELSASENRYRTLVEESPHGIVVCDVQGKLQAVNRRYMELVGAPSLELVLEVNPLEFGPFADSDIADKIARCLRGGETTYGELAYTTTWGKDVHFAFSFAPLFNDDGEILGGQALVQDIAERARAEDALRLSEERHRVLVDHGPLGVIACDRQGNVRTANDQMVQLIGAPSRGEVLESNLLESPRMRAAGIAEIVRQCLDAGEHGVAEAGFRTRWGNERYIRMHYAPIRDATGAITGAQGFVEDLTERREAERALRETEQQIRLVMETVPVGVAACDREGRILFANPQFIDFVRIDSVQELLDMVNVFEYPAFRDTGVAELARQCIERNEPASTETTFAFATGAPVELRLQFAPWRDDAGEVTGCLAIVQDVAERRRAEALLAQSQTSLAKAQEIAHIGNWIWDLRNRTIHHSAESLRIMGESESREAFPQDKALEWLHPDDVGMHFEHMEGYLEGRPQDFEYRVVWPTGEARWVHEIGEVQLGEDGYPERVVGIAQDITDRKRAEEALQQRERDLAEAQALAHMGSWVWDLEDPAMWSTELYRIFGVEPDTFQPTLDAFFTCVHPEDRVALERAISDIIATHDSVDYRFRIMRPDGAERTIAARGTVVRDGGGDAVRLMGTMQDVTEQADAEAERTLLATAIDEAAEGMVITDATGTIDYVNPAFERITGYRRNEVVGQTMRLLKSGKHDTGFYRDLWATITRGDAWRGHFTNRRKDGTLYEEDAVISPVRDAEGRITQFVKTTRDVTQERELEGQLRQVQKMEAIGTLAGGIAHDINNILTAVLGFGELIKDAAEPESSIAEDIAELLTAGNRARELVAQILTFSRRTPSERASLQVARVVNEAVRLLRAALPSTIELSEELDYDVYATADPTEIHQVVMNLGTNAAQAMEGRGTLRFTLEQVELDRPFCARHQGLQPGPHLRLTVADSGHGMDAPTAQRIFEPYFTTKGAGSGTGLGLAVVHGIVQSLHGAITLDSAVGEGSTFQVYLPTTVATEPAADSGTRAALQGGTEHIMVVDDEEPVRAVAERALRRLGYEVTICASGADALEQLRTAPHRYALIISDNTMPEMTGIELSRAVHDLRSDLPVVLCTGLPDAATMRAARRAGILDVVQKPITPSALGETVRRVLDTPTPR